MGGREAVFLELGQFAPEIMLTAPDDVFLAPGGQVRNRREARGLGASGSRTIPEVADHRLPGRQPRQPVQRHRELRLSDTLAEREARAVPREELGGGFVALVHLDLFDGGVAFDVHDPVAAQQVVVQFVRATEVEQGVAFFVEIIEEGAAEAGGFLGRFVARAEGPAVFESEF